MYDTIKKEILLLLKVGFWSNYYILTVWITKNWKILKEMGIPDHLTCLLRNLYAGQEATVRTGREQSYGLCGRGRGWEDLGEWH